MPVEFPHKQVPGCPVPFPPAPDPLPPAAAGMTTANATINTISVTKIFFMFFYSFAPYDEKPSSEIRAKPLMAEFLPNLYTIRVKQAGRGSKLHPQYDPSPIYWPYPHCMVCVLINENRNDSGTRITEARFAV
jgi:hypothetical protein